MRLLFVVLVMIPASLLGQSSPDELINVKELIPDIVLDLRYSGTDNFTHQKLYTTNECLLALGAVKRLQIVQDSLRVRGLGLKIYDGYRPRAVQFLMWEIFPDPNYVAPPTSGSNHNRGAAVDLSLVNLSTGKELWMPTPFDTFGQLAWHGTTTGLTDDQIANRELLRDMMERVGQFARYDIEWWHYTYSPALSNPLFDFQMK